MKGVALALFGFGVFLSIAIFLLRARSWKKHYKALLIALPPGLLVYAASYAITPRDLYGMPPNWIEPSSSVDFFNGLLIFMLLMHCVWDVLYAAAVTGFSAGLMVKLDGAMPHGMTADRLIQHYQRKGGQDAVFERRIANLVLGGYIERQGENIRLTLKGTIVALVARFFKKFLNVGKGG